MVSINTNLSSLIVQGNLTNATNGLNKAIERLSTGYKINHASDNAANYSIANTYESKMSSYEVAASNVQSGLDLLSVAQDTISTMQDHGARLQALITQARNGTYGTQSLNAMTQEAGALISEIQRMYTNTEYNNISLLQTNSIALTDWAQTVKESAVLTEDAGLISEIKVNEKGFISEAISYSDSQVAEMLRVSEVNVFTAGNKYAIYSKEELQKLATMVNSGSNTTNVEFVLGSDIDLSSIKNWDAIGCDSTHPFKGTFNGNGHKIKNLTINKPDKNYQGLFGYGATASKYYNVSMENVNIKGADCVAGILGRGDRSITIKNVNVTGQISGNGSVAGIFGYGDYYCKILDSYSQANVTGTASNIGGIFGLSSYSSNIENCFADGKINGNNRVGGIGGYISNSTKVTNCCSISDVMGQENIGGLIGGAYTHAEIINNYSEGHVEGETNVGGLVGNCEPIMVVSKNYSSCSVQGKSNVGGLVGYEGTSCDVSNNYTSGNVSGNSAVGGLVGYAYAAQITNCYAEGFILGGSYVGGLVGYCRSNIDNSYASGSVHGTSNVGGLAGYLYNYHANNSYATGNVSGTTHVGGILGQAIGTVNMENCYSIGDVEGKNFIGGAIGSYNSVDNNSKNLSYIMSAGEVKGENAIGSLIGGIIATTEARCKGVKIDNASCVSQKANTIGGWYGSESISSIKTTDLPSFQENITEILKPDSSKILQVGIKSDNSSRISFDSTLKYDLSPILGNITSDFAYETINKFMSTLSAKATDLGAISNRLESSLESIAVNMQNLGDSLSTVKDVDMAEVSSEYIKKQILQQASATLLATANQSPAIALQLI